MNKIELVFTCRRWALAVCPLLGEFWYERGVGRKAVQHEEEDLPKGTPTPEDIELVKKQLNAAKMDEHGVLTVKPSKITRLESGEVIGRCAGPGCHNKFSKREDSNRFCCRACYYASKSGKPKGAKQKRFERDCAVCAGPFTTASKRQRCCSPGCAKKFQRAVNKRLFEK